MPSIDFKSLDGPTLLKRARLLATREEAITEAQRRVDNGSRSRFPHEVLAKYAQAPEPTPEPTPAAPITADKAAAAMRDARKAAMAVAKERAQELAALEIAETGGKFMAAFIRHNTVLRAEVEASFPQ